MQITIITLFPSMIEGFLRESIVGRAIQRGFVKLELINLRDFARDSYGSVDDRPYGGGAGMILRVDVLYECLKSVVGKNEITKRSPKSQVPSSGTRIILTSAKGHTYSQAKAEKYAKRYDHLVIVAGHYEGVDERFLAFVDDEISIGSYVLTGGELPAAVIADSIVRLIPGVLTKEDATIHESYSLIEHDDGDKQVKRRMKEYPHYTRPEEYMGMRVPDVLRSGDHRKIRAWRTQQSVTKTKVV